MSATEAIFTVRTCYVTVGDRVVRKSPITPGHLFAILRNLTVRMPRDAAVFAACLLMFFGLLRRSNVLPPTGNGVDPQRHLRRSDVSFTQDGARVSE